MTTISKYFMFGNMHDSLIFKDHQVVIPTTLRGDMTRSTPAWV